MRCKSLLAAFLLIATTLSAQVQPPPAPWRGAGPTPFEISVRPIWQMINEIGHCLAEAVVASADDADRGVVLGLGWPPLHRAPLAYARWVGVRNIVEQLHAWAAQYGPRFTPSPVLCEVAQPSRMTTAAASPG